MTPAQLLDSIVSRKRNGEFDQQGSLRALETFDQYVDNFEKQLQQLQAPAGQEELLQMGSDALLSFRKASATLKQAFSSNEPQLEQQGLDLAQQGASLVDQILQRTS
ncbi:hypothetical protein JST97_03215 [bacterium]|nr:hypothetical protein [bacterium]